MEVGGLAHVEHVAGGVGEPVDAGPVGEAGGEAELGRLGVAHQPGQVEQLLEADDAERAGPLEQGVQQVAGGQDVGQRPVGRLVGEVQGGGQGAELAVGHHVAHEAAGQGQGVDGGVGQAVPAGGLEGVVEEGEVEADVVADDHPAAQELEERGEHLAERGASATMASLIPVSAVMNGGMRSSGRTKVW